MKSFLAILCLALASFTAGAVELVTATITITNNPIGNSNTITIIGSTRTVTNSITASPGTLIQQTNSAPLFTTNLLNHLTLFPASTGHYLSQSSPTNILLRGRVGEVLTVSIAGLWGTVIYNTNNVTVPTFLVRMPITSEAATNRTYIASLIAQAISDYATNAIATNATALSNYITKGASIVQIITAPVQFFGNIEGGKVAFTNGFIIGVTNINPVTVSLVNYSNAIRSEGIGGNSLQLGSNAVAAGLRTVAIGNNAYATNDEAAAIGYGAIATNKAVAVGTSAVAGQSALALGRQASALYISSTSLGNGATSIGGNSVALGNGAEAGTNAIALGKSSVADAESSIVLGTGAGVDPAAINSIVIGAGASATHSNAVVIGNGAASSSTNQVVIGAATDQVNVPGVFYAASAKDNTLRGTNHLNGDLSFARYSNTSMINGNNTGIIIGTNVIVELSGATTIARYGGFVASRDGDQRIIRMSGAVTNVIVDANDAVWSPDGTAANRIVTGTGAALYLTNSPSWIRMTYRATSSRWEVESRSN